MRFPSNGVHVLTSGVDGESGRCRKVVWRRCEDRKGAEDGDADRNEEQDDRFDLGPVATEPE